MIRPLPPGWTRPVEVEGTDELREALVADIVATLYRVQLDRGIGMSVFGRIAIADALLAGPLAPLLAKVQAVEALVDQWDARRVGCPARGSYDNGLYVGLADAARDLRSALGGESRG